MPRPARGARVSQKRDVLPAAVRVREIVGRAVGAAAWATAGTSERPAIAAGSKNLRMSSGFLLQETVSWHTQRRRREKPARFDSSGTAHGEDRRAAEAAGR